MTEFSSSECRPVGAQAFRLVEAFCECLATPASGPRMVSTCELLHSLDEIPLNVTWRFSEGEREKEGLYHGRTDAGRRRQAPPRIGFYPGCVSNARQL